MLLFGTSYNFRHGLVAKVHVECAHKRQRLHHALILYLYHAILLFFFFLRSSLCRDFHFVPREKKLARSPGRDLKSHFISIATDQSFRAAFDCKSQGKKKESKRNDGNGERTCDHLVSQRNGVQIHVIRQDTAVVMATMA
jgi:hypothetical protein